MRSAIAHVKNISQDLLATDTFIRKWNESRLPLLTSQPQSITACWPVLISRPAELAEGNRLNWPEWLVIY